jgi:uncharacterized lipoprotein YajG
MKKLVIIGAIMVITIAGIYIAGCTSPSSTTSNQTTTATASQIAATKNVGANVTQSTNAYCSTTWAKLYDSAIHKPFHLLPLAGSV